MSESTDTRYPYTYCADLIRGWGGYGQLGTNLSRVDAANIKAELAKVLGMDERTLACTLADYYLANQQSLTEQNVKRAICARDYYARRNDSIG